MDPLAHTLTGVVLAKSGIERKVGAGSVLALVLASNVVDIDVFGAFFIDEPTWTFRRMWTHSLLTAPVLVLLASYLFSRFYKNARWHIWAGVFLLGASFHVFMDLINSYGVVLFFPLSIERFELSWVFIVDLYIWGMLVFSLLAPRLGRRVSLQIDGERSARLGLLGLLLYLALCGGLREKSFSMLRETAGAASSASAFSYVFPEPFGPWRFRGVLRMADEYKVYLIRPLSGELEYRKSYLTEEREPSVIRLRDSSSGRKYEWFFKAPLWKRVSDEEALVSDIRFKSLLFEREGAFTYTVSSHSSDSR